MFTGIIQGLASVLENEGGVLLLRGDAEIQDWQTGESVAINGCCLTLVDFADGLRFELSPETLNRTALGELKPGSRVNLERALRAADRLGGHFVQGHVDAAGRIKAMSPSGNSTVVSVEAPAEYGRYLTDKGSIAVDGISLTVVSPTAGAFDVSVIPHTMHNTSLSQAKVGQRVNLEFDMLAKYVEKLLKAGGS